MIWLKRILIHRLRGVAHEAELLFSRGTNVLLGQNGAGKTTLLELCAAALSGNFRHFANEPFHIEAEIACGNELLEVSIQGFGAFESPETSRGQLIPPTVGTEDTARPRRWELHARYTRDSFSWRVESTQSGTTITVGDESQPIQHASPLEGPIYASFIWGLMQPKVLSTESVGELGIWLLTSAGVFRMDEGLGVFNNLFAAEQRSGPVVVLREDEHGPSRQTRLFPDSYFKDLRGDGLAKLLDEDSLTVSDASWLTEFRAWIGANGAYFKLRRVSRTLTDGRPVVVFARPELEVRLSDKLLVLQDSLSFGQKRLFAFLYMLELNPTAPVIADELVNGLHHSWIQRCLSKLEGKRQAFLASQNPLLLDHLEFQTASDAQAAFIICAFEDDRFRWRQMTAQESEDFFESYELGIQHVGAILRTRGLW